MHEGDKALAPFFDNRQAGKHHVQWDSGESSSRVACLICWSSVDRDPKTHMAVSVSGPVDGTMGRTILLTLDMKIKWYEWLNTN